MKRTYFKFFCMVISLVMILSTSVFAYDTSSETSLAFEPHEHNSDCTDAVELNPANIEISPMGTCYLGHWFSYDDKTTTKHSYYESGSTPPCKISWAKRCTNCDTITGWVQAANTCYQH